MNSKNYSNKKITATLYSTSAKIKKTHSADFTSPDVKSDHTGNDNDADRTVKTINPPKSKLEIKPDSTGIDTKADKTKKAVVTKQSKK